MTIEELSSILRAAKEDFAGGGAPSARLKLTSFGLERLLGRIEGGLGSLWNRF